MENKLPVKYDYEIIEGWYHVYVHYDGGETRFVCRVQSKQLADALVKEFNENT